MNSNLRMRLSFYVVASVVLLGLPPCWSQDQIDQASLTSLKISILRNNVEIGTATGFVMDRHNKHYLLTNRHVMLACGHDRNPGNIGAWICANKLAILHNKLNRPGEWFWVAEDLFDEHGNKRWLEHPTLGGGADLVALPLQNTGGVQFYPLDIELRKTDIVVGPGDAVSIVGFPLGLSQELGLPIWKTGTVASDFHTNWNGKPMFLVDTTSRPGMSGSPVYAVRTGVYATSQRALMMNAGAARKFLGVYSEQMLDVEVGGVWKAEAVAALYDALP